MDLQRLVLNQCKIPFVNKPSLVFVKPIAWKRQIGCYSCYNISFDVPTYFLINLTITFSNYLVAFVYIFSILLTTKINFILGIVSVSFLRIPPIIRDTNVRPLVIISMFLRMISSMNTCSYIMIWSLDDFSLFKILFFFC